MMVRQGLFDKVKFEHRPEGREGESHMDKRKAFPVEATAQVQTP